MKTVSYESKLMGTLTEYTHLELGFIRVVGERYLSPKNNSSYTTDIFTLGNNQGHQGHELTQLYAISNYAQN